MNPVLNSPSADKIATAPSEPVTLFLALVILEFDRREAIKEWVEMFYLTTHLTHFIYGYMTSDIW